jgi:SecD/SecF fusion protein
MIEKNLGQRFLIIAGVLLFAGLMLRTYGLRPGNDIAGGVSMVFEIDTAGAAPYQNLAEEMKQLLQRRVDPKGVYGLEWRVIGNNRLEVQMPLPPKEVAALREVYDGSIKALSETQITRGQLQRILSETPEKRQSEIATLVQYDPETKALVDKIGTMTDAEIQQRLAEELVGDKTDQLSSALAVIQRDGAQGREAELRQKYGTGPARRVERVLSVLPLPAEERVAALKRYFGGAVAKREQLLPQAAEASEKWLATQAKVAELAAAEDTPADVLRQAQIELRDAEEDRDDLFDAVLATNFPLNQFRDLLELPESAQTRQQALYEWRNIEYPSLAEKIDAAITAHADWKKNATFLDGPEDLRRLLRGAGVLSFRILVEPNPDNRTKYDRLREILSERGPRAASSADEAWFKIDDPVNFFNLDSAADLQDRDPRSFQLHVVGQYAGDWYVLAHTDPSRQMLGDTQRSWQLTSAFRGVDQLGRPNVRFEFDARGASLFGSLTGNNIGKQLCIFVDAVAYSAANIQSRISSNGEITGQFTEDKVRYLVRSMNAGALPARLKDTPISERTLGSNLGEANRDKAFRAGWMGVIAVGLIMAVYYFTSGMIANVALVMNIVLVLSVMSMLSARISLAGIAGIILTIGMTVDANVLIFERMREEKERGASLRMIIKNGYDKAFSTIIDANITTLLTSIIIAYQGSEEIKGFGVTLGWGIVTSLFTSLFVTRTIFAFLAKMHWISDIKMLHVIGVPKIDWYGKRGMFLPISLIVIVVGLSLLIGRGAEALDVEFRGGVNAEVELRDATFANGDSVDDIHIKQRLSEVARTMRDAESKLDQATIDSVSGDPTLFYVRLNGVEPENLAALIAEPLEEEDVLARAGVDSEAIPDGVAVRVAGDVSQDGLKLELDKLAANPKINAVETLTRVKVNKVIDTESPELDGLIWSVTTTVTNKRLVEQALETAMGDNLKRQSKIDFTFVGDNGKPFPVTEGTLREVIPGMPTDGPAIDITNYLDGAVMYFTQLTPPVAPEVLMTRLRNMRLQPDYAELPWRQFEVLGVSPTGTSDDEGRALFNSIAVVVLDNQYPFSQDPEGWAELLAQPELDLVTAALGTEQSLRKVSTFKPQIASQSQQKAIIALVLSWVMIVAYLWIRFGKPSYGVAGVVALIHDVLIALAAVGISGFLGQTGLFHFMLIHDFPINMTIVAAFLTIIGYSINDTIVVFDRIRETRGRLGQVTPDVINTSINQCLARTIMTSLTTMVVLLTMYIFGGDSIRGFNYCMIVGIITGTYSSIAVAAPILMMGMQRADRRRARQTATA